MAKNLIHDTIKQYKKHILEIIEQYANRKPVNRPDVAYHQVIDEKRDQYILLALGWHKQEYIHNWIFHLQLQDGKIWIHEDLTDPGVKVLLMERGVPESDIILGFIPEYERKASQLTAM